MLLTIAFLKILQRKHALNQKKSFFLQPLSNYFCYSRFNTTQLVKNSDFKGTSIKPMPSLLKNRSQSEYNFFLGVGKSFYLLQNSLQPNNIQFLLKAFRYPIQLVSLKLCFLGYVHIPKIGLIPFQIIVQKLVKRCDTMITADVCKIQGLIT